MTLPPPAGAARPKSRDRKLTPGPLLGRRRRRRRPCQLHPRGITLPVSLREYYNRCVTPGLGAGSHRPEGGCQDWLLGTRENVLPIGHERREDQNGKGYHGVGPAVAVELGIGNMVHHVDEYSKERGINDSAG